MRNTLSAILMCGGLAGFLCVTIPWGSKPKATSKVEVNSLSICGANPCGGGSGEVVPTKKASTQVQEDADGMVFRGTFTNCGPTPCPDIPIRYPVVDHANTVDCKGVLSGWIGRDRDGVYVSCSEGKRYILGKKPLPATKASTKATHKLTGLDPQWSLDGATKCDWDPNPPDMHILHDNEWVQISGATVFDCAKADYQIGPFLRTSGSLIVSSAATASKQEIIADCFHVTLTKADATHYRSESVNTCGRELPNVYVLLKFLDSDGARVGVSHWEAHYVAKGERLRHVFDVPAAVGMWSSVVLRKISDDVEDNGK